MPTQKLCDIIERQKLTEDIWSLRLNAGELARSALPGQFVHIKCGDGLLLRRPISICDAEGDTLRIVFQARGAGTRWLAERTEGDRLDVLGPLGRGFQVPEAGEILLVGGGIGTAPMVFTARRTPGRVRAALGFRTGSGVILAGELERAGVPTAVATEDGSVGTPGRVDALVRERLSAETYAAVLACGPTPMLRAAAQAAREAGVPCQVSLEERMGCGIGVCLTCSCGVSGHYLRVCKDGPVFDAEEVDWDA